MRPKHYRPFTLLLLLSAPCLFAEIGTISGREIMDEVYQRHQQYPYIYEEQVMVMVDRNGYRDTRKVRRYSRTEQDGTVKFLLVFVSPREVKGVALLAERDPAGNTKKSVYLPAYGDQLIESSGEGEESNFLGTDFSVENLTGEMLDNYIYVRRMDKKIEGAANFVLDVFVSEDAVRRRKPLRRHFIRQDNYYITLTHHYDKNGRIYKQQSHHDLKQVDGNMWRASMILMEDKKEQHQSLIKIDRL